jgi:hypothetical protein
MVVLLNDYLGLEDRRYPNLIYYNLSDESLANIFSDSYREYIVTRISRRPIRKENVKHYAWIIDCLRESHDSRVCNRVYQILIDIGVDHEKILFLVSVDDKSEFFSKTVFCHSWFSRFHQHYVSQSLQHTGKIEKTFVCLMRRPHNPRIILADYIQQNFDNKNKFVLSLGTDSRHSKSIFVDDLVDGTIKCHDVSQMIGSLINVIAETSSDEQPLKYNSFLSEKTFKCFALKQIPLWYGHTNLCRTAKSLGFDVFEDVFDHHMISDSDSWSDKASKICEMLIPWTTMSADQLTDAYYRYESRLVYNQNLANQFFLSNKRNLDRQIKSWHDSVTG